MLSLFNTIWERDRRTDRQNSYVNIALHRGCADVQQKSTFHKHKLHLKYAQIYDEL